MTETRRLEIVRHLSEEDLNHAINEAQQAGEAHLVRRLCYVKKLYAGDFTKRLPDVSVCHR